MSPFRSRKQRSFLKRTKPELYKKWKKKYGLKIKAEGGEQMKQKKKTTTKKKMNPWMEHLKEFKAKNPGKPYRECMALAKKTYKPIKK